MTRATHGGRPIKGGQRRKVLATKVPPQLHDLLVAEAERRGVPVCDLGALFLLRAWNAEQMLSGLPEVPVPEYLDQAALPVPRFQVQEPLLAS